MHWNYLIELDGLQHRIGDHECNCNVEWLGCSLEIVTILMFIVAREKNNFSLWINAENSFVSKVITRVTHSVIILKQEMLRVRQHLDFFPSAPIVYVIRI